MTNGAKERIYRIISGVLDVPLESVNDATCQEDIPTWDSLAHIHLIVALEGEFSLSFTPEQAVEMTTVPAIRDAIRATGVPDA